MTDAKARAETLAAGEKSGKRQIAPEPQPSTPHSHVVGAGEDGESPARSQSASPFSYVRRQLAGVSAKAKGAQRNKAAPKPKASPKATSAAGGKRKSTGGGGDPSLSSKQAELRQQNGEVFNTLDSTIEQIKVGFSTGTLDKSLLNTLAENCKRAIGFFAKPKHLDTKKLERLNCISGPLEAMKGFATTAAKKERSASGIYRSIRCLFESQCRCALGVCEESCEMRMGWRTSSKELQRCITTVGRTGPHCR